MRIVIPTTRSRGDVQPFIALAQSLSRAGHTVTLASHLSALCCMADLVVVPTAVAAGKTKLNY